jgi:class 3 adenylate cyclase
MEPLLRKYYATHGKHVGDGMVYYFFPQPDCSYVMNAIRCAQEMKDTMREISRTWRNRKNWTNELRFNIGLDEGQEWFGTYQTATHIEFTVLGDTINTAGRLSDFARSGAVWVTKSMLGKLSSKERAGVHFGVRRTGEDGAEIIVPTTYSRISNLVDLENPRYEKFHDIGVLPVTEILDVEPRKS